MTMIVTKISRNLQYARLYTRLTPTINYYSTESDKKEPEIPENELQGIYSSQIQPNGKPYDKKPHKYVCIAGRNYSWCLCGQSKSQPFCDATHRNIFLNIKLRPVKFQVKETKEYWLCNCKQTSNRPFCDGSHKCESIQSMRFLNN